MKDLIERLTSRKFLLALAALAAIFFVDHSDQLNDVAVRIADLAAALGITTAYVAGNVAEKKAN